MSLGMTIRSWFFHVRDHWTTYQNLHVPVTLDYFLFNTSACITSAITYRPSEAVVLRDVINAENAFVKTIEWCKGKALPYHEFLLFHVVEGSSPLRQTYIVVERGVSPDKIKLEELGTKDAKPERYLNAEEATADCDGIDAQVQARIEAKAAQMHDTPSMPPARSSPVPSSSSSSTSSSLSSIPFSSSRNSEDRVIFNRYKLASKSFVPHKFYDVLYKLEIQSDVFSLPRLAVLVDIVHRYYPRYKAWAYQSFWFAKTIYCTVKFTCETEEMGTKEIKRRCSYRCGKFGKIPVPHGGMALEHGILERFRGAWDKQREIVRMEKELKKKEIQKEVAKAIGERRKTKAENLARQELEARQQAEDRAEQAEERAEQEHEARRQAERRAAAAEEELRQMKAAYAKK